MTEARTIIDSIGRARSLMTELAPKQLTVCYWSQLHAGKLGEAMAAEDARKAERGPG